MLARVQAAGCVCACKALGARTCLRARTHSYACECACVGRACMCAMLCAAPPVPRPAVHAADGRPHRCSGRCPRPHRPCCCRRSLELEPCPPEAAHRLRPRRAVQWPRHETCKSGASRPTRSPTRCGWRAAVTSGTPLACTHGRLPSTYPAREAACRARRTPAPAWRRCRTGCRHAEPASPSRLPLRGPTRPPHAVVVAVPLRASPCCSCELCLELRAGS